MFILSILISLFWSFNKDNIFAKLGSTSPYCINLFNLSWNILSFLSDSSFDIFKLSISSFNLSFSSSVLIKFSLNLLFSFSNSLSFNSCSWTCFSFSSKFFIISCIFCSVICIFLKTFPLSSACLIKGLIRNSFNSSSNLPSLVL